MKRQVVAGLALAGALSLWAGASAFANENSGDPAEALLQAAETAASIASDTVSNCAEAQIATFEAAKPPTGVSEDAAEQAVDTAVTKVENRAAKAQSDIEAALEAFESQVERADEDGTTLPAVQKTPDFTSIANQACSDISSITISWPSPSVTSTDKENDTERETEHETTASGTARD